MNELKTIKHKVEALLKEYPITRDDDKVLFVYYLKKYHSVEKIEDIIKKDIPAIESIRRCRQKIQEEGRWLPTELISIARSKKRQEYIDFSKTK